MSAETETIARILARGFNEHIRLHGPDGDHAGEAAELIGGGHGIVVTREGVQYSARVERFEVPETQVAPSLADRVTEILADAGYTDARIVFPGGFLVTEGPGYATTGWVVVSVPWADGTDAERRRILAAFAAALRDGGLEVAVRARYLNVRTQPGEARDDA